MVQSIPEDIDPNSFAGQTVLGPCKALSGPEKNSEAAWATMFTRSLAWFVHNKICCLCLFHSWTVIWIQTNGFNILIPCPIHILYAPILCSQSWSYPIWNHGVSGVTWLADWEDVEMLSGAARCSMSHAARAPEVQCCGIRATTIAFVRCFRPSQAAGIANVMRSAFWRWHLYMFLKRLLRYVYGFVLDFDWCVNTFYTFIHVWVHVKILEHDSNSV